MEQRKICLLVSALTAVFCTNGVSSVTCSSSTDPCRCDTDEGMVDLSSLDSGDSTNPRYRFIPFREVKIKSSNIIEHISFRHISSECTCVDSFMFCTG